jgi:hypothetical protein
MNCRKCRKRFAAEETRCPHCGEANPESSGMFHTSSVLISAAGADMVYRSVDEVPPRLRSRLLKSTNGANSATILIADRRGRKEIARAMRKLPGPAQRRLMQSVLGAEASSNLLEWLTPARRRAILALIALLVVALIAFVFTHHWQ